MAHIPQTPLPPPHPTSGTMVWLRKNIFNGIGNTIISLVSVGIVLYALYNFASWLIFSSDWQIVWNNMRLLSVFRYPIDLMWRPIMCVALLMGLFGLSAGISNEGTGFIIRRAFYWVFALIVVVAIVAFMFWEDVRIWWAIVVFAAVNGYFIGTQSPNLSKYLGLFWVNAWFICLFLLSGVGSPEGEGPFRFVSSDLWGGILLSFLLSVTGIVLCFPLGIALALGRGSNLPAIKWFCTFYIEIIRGAPLVSWLFMASLMLPLMIGGYTPAAVIRAQVAIILFAAAYMAENVRGGLQALPKGQPEAAHALGLTPWDTTSIIILPQALRAVIPAIVGLFIGLFKDTTLVTIVGLSDIFQASLQVSTQPEAILITGGIVRELFIFMAVFFWFFCYRMSVASRQLEQQLGLGTR